MIPKYLLLRGWLVLGGAGAATQAHAQAGTLSAGGSVSSPAGSVSYSVGQLTTVEARGPAGTSSPGNQQPLEIFVVTATHGVRLAVAASAYPNPTTDVLTLRVAEKHAGLTWYLQDMGGRQLRSEPVRGPLTSISLAPFPAGTYVLIVRGKAQEFNTSKIIKH